MTKIEKNTFDGCTGLASVGLPSSLETIGEVAFYSCESLKSVIIPDSVTTIGKEAFHGCSGLKSIQLSSSLKTIDKYAFMRSGLETVNIPEGVKTIKEQAFSYCNSLTKATIPSTLKTVEESLFSSCQKLKSITIPEGVTAIKSCAFQECSGLTSVTLPSTLKTVETGLFYSCKKLKSITIPEGVTSIKSNAFQECPELKSIIIPDSVKKIEQDCFDNGVKIICNNGSYAETYAAEEDSCSAVNPTGLLGYTQNSKSSVTLKTYDNYLEYNYKYYMYNEKTKKYKELYGGKEKTCKVKGLKAGKEYKFKVKRTYDHNGKTVISGESPVLKVKTVDYAALNKQINSGKTALVTEKRYSSDTFNYVSWWDRWETVSDVCQFKDPKGNMYFAYINAANKLEINKLNSGLTAKKVLTLKKQLPQLGTVVADEKGYFYVVWGAETGTNKKETAIKISKYNSKGKLIKSVSYPRESIDTVTPFGAGCEATIANGYLHVLFSKERFDGHQQSIAVAVKTSNMKKADNMTNDFWCSHSFAQRILTDSSGNAWYANKGDCYPRAFLASAPGVNNEVFHFYCSKKALNDYDMMTVNYTNADLGGLAETSRGVFLVGSSVKGMTEKEYNSQSRNIFITSADGSVKLDGAKSRTGTVFGNRFTDKNIKWLTNYSANYSVNCVQTVQTDNDSIIIMWEVNNTKAYDKSHYYTVLDGKGNILQKATRINNVSLNNCETPIYKDGCVYWIADSSSGSGTSVYKLEVGKLKG